MSKKAGSEGRLRARTGVPLGRHTVAVEANIEPVHPHAGHSSDRKRCPGGPHTCEHQRTHAGLSSTRQWPPTACTPSLAAALVGAPQQRLASAKSAASTKLWKRPGLPPGMRQHSPCDHPPTCRQQWSALTSPTAWHTIGSRRLTALAATRRRPRAACAERAACYGICCAGLTISQQKD